MIGLFLAAVIIFGVLALQYGKNSGDPSLPPRLFPAFENGEDAEEPMEFVAPETLVELWKSPRTIEVFPHGTIQYALTIKNVGTRLLQNIVAEERFDDAILSVVQGGSGSVSENRIAWNIETISPGEDVTLQYEFRLEKIVPSPRIQTTSYLFGDDLMDMTSSSRMASSNITVLSLPESGVELGLVLRWISTLLE